MSETDSFEPVRKAIRAAQATLRAEEQVYTETIAVLVRRCAAGEITHTQYAHWQEHLLQHIRIVEDRIVHLREMMPPYTVQRDGYLERMPAFEAIDPRETV